MKLAEVFSTKSFLLSLRFPSNRIVGAVSKDNPLKQMGQLPNSGEEKLPRDGSEQDESEKSNRNRVTVHLKS